MGGKFFFGVITGMAIVVVIELVMFGLVVLHCKETNARSEWKKNSLAIVDKMTEKQKENGWTYEETRAYGEKLKDSLGIQYPKPCPYCFVKGLFSDD